MSCRLCQGLTVDGQWALTLWWTNVYNKSCQSAHNSHMVYADWIVKYSTRQESKANLCVKWVMLYMQHVSAPNIARFCGVKYQVSKACRP